MGDRVFFGDLVTQWAASVAHDLVAMLGEQARECWVGRDHAIYLRYRERGKSMGVRLDDLLTDRLTETCLATFAADSVLATAESQAATFYDAVWSSGVEPEWTDDEGHRWWGDRRRVDWTPVDWRAAVGGNAVAVIAVG